MSGKFLPAVVLALAALSLAPASEPEAPANKRIRAAREEKEGNYQTAYDLYRELALDAANDPKFAVTDIARAFAMLGELNLRERQEPFLDEVEAKWGGSWRVLAELARLRLNLPPTVELVNGEYVRTNAWRGNILDASERDRVLALRLMLRAEALLGQASDADRTEFYLGFADILGRSRLDGAAWRLTALTDLERLPDREDRHARFAHGERGAPVDADGNPIFYPVPESWDAAENDGQRWRWLLGRIARFGGDDGRVQTEMAFARFLLGQFGVQTMGHVPLPRDAGTGGETGAFAVRTLSENETVARLATGVKRFALPDEFNFIRIFRDVSQAANSRPALDARRQLARIFENRQQYPKAAEQWQRVARDGRDKDAEKSYRRIVEGSGALEPGQAQPAGSKTSLPYLFRNGGAVAMTASRLDEKALLADVRALIRLGRRTDDEDLNLVLNRPDQIGRLAVERNARKYVGETVAEWEVKLDPLPDHLSRRVQIELPFTEAGCYLVTAKMRDGNVSRAVLWLADLALVRKPAHDRQILYVADAVTGAPAAGADVTLFGHSRRQYRDSGSRPDRVREFAEKADADGLVVLNASDMTDYDWLIVAETADGRLAYSGFDSIWVEPSDSRSEPGETAFIMTDRPVYRPNQKVNFKIWLGQPSHGGDGQSSYPANRELKVEIRNPRGEAIYEKTLITDTFGGVSDAVTLDGTAPLGSYAVTTANVPGNAWFRLEEYRKPEFEVKVETPDQALALGDTAQVGIRADYYFGAPVAGGKVNYKVTRTVFNRAWQPPWRWDWLYGAGSWRQSHDYHWLPGWDDWSLAPALPAWFPPRHHAPPELVAEGEGRLDADGVFRLPLDTMPAKELYGDRDHQYEISVEVADQSRRIVAGSGTVIASRKPFTVAVWTDRGYYLAGQRLDVSVKAARPGGQPVRAVGKAVLHRLSYDADGNAGETEILSRDVATDADGAAVLSFQADSPGQYRLSCVLADAGGVKVEGAAVVTVRGGAGEGDFRFAAIELVAERREYRPGDRLRLAVNSERKDAVVLFFPRVERAGSRPSLVRLENGGGTVELDVMPEDRPNFFCTVVTVFDGQTHSETREIFVPPVAKTLNVEVTPDAESLAPGGRADFKVAVTDADGEPVSGECVVTLYDKAVEYVSGGSNVGDIRAHFWRWKRSHSPYLMSSLDRYGYRAEKRGDVEWEPIGMFGSQEADWNETAVHVNGKLTAGSAPPRMPRSRMAREEIVLEALAAPMAAMAAPEADMATGGGVEMYGGGEAMAEAKIRSEFADTAYWNAALRTDSLGRASFSVDMPENLTAWKARVWTMGAGVRVGEGEAEIATRKNIMVRPQLPRFLTQTDEVVLSANLHNYLPRAKSARVELVLEGGLLEPADAAALSRAVALAANGEARVDWRVKARRPGTARVVMKILTDEESDAAAIAVPVVVHGARRVEGFGGVIRGDETESIVRFRVPAERLADRSRLELSFSPSIAASLLEALPYLIEYPYGCTEQTLNRFLPAVMTRSYLDKLGLSLADAAGAAGRADAKSAEWLRKFGEARKDKSAAVFDDAELAAMTRQGLERLAAMQNADGGWGWFSGPEERSWPHTTAVVVHGLAAARANGAAIPSGMLERGIDWLRGYQNRQIERLENFASTDPEKAGNGKEHPDNLDAFIYMILAEQGRFNPHMRDRLHADRLELSLSGLAMLGIALHREGATNRLPAVLRNLEQFLERDGETGTAWLRTAESGWWWWYNDAIETQCWYLMLLSRTDPAGDAASGLARYILRNRKNGSHWRSTRDTAYAVEALTRYAAASGETAPDMTVSVFHNGAKVMERIVKAENLLDDNRFVLEGLAVEEGDHELRVVRSGKGNLYIAGALDLFSLEDPIARAGLEIKVDRAFYRLVREEGTVSAPDSSGRAGAVAVEKYRRERLASPFDAGAAMAAVRSGDLVEVELTIETKNDYEYLVFEDMKAAGLEAVELRSGYGGNSIGAYVEYRDEKVVLFVRRLPKGIHTVSYRFRAETPGSFSALPVFGGGMYATDLFANSDEMKIRVED